MVFKEDTQLIDRNSILAKHFLFLVMAQQINPISSSYVEAYSVESGEKDQSGMDYTEDPHRDYNEESNVEHGNTFGMDYADDYLLEVLNALSEDEENVDRNEHRNEKEKIIAKQEQSEKKMQERTKSFKKQHLKSNKQQTTTTTITTTTAKKTLEKQEHSEKKMQGKTKTFKDFCRSISNDYYIHY